MASTATDPDSPAAFSWAKTMAPASSRSSPLSGGAKAESTVRSNRKTEAPTK
jgi:hypothetical protein